MAFNAGDAGHVHEHNMLAGIGALVTRYGAIGDGTTDDTAAIIAALDASPVAIFPPGTYRTTSTIDLGTNARTLLGFGHTGQDSSVGFGSTCILVDHAGWGFTYAQAAASAQFAGCSVSGLHIRQGATTSAGAIWIDHAANCHIRDTVVSDFSAGAGVRFGNTDATGSQYHVVSGCTISDCLIGIDVRDTNGVRVSDCFIENDTTSPSAGSVGVRSDASSDTLMVIGSVIQGFDKLLTMAGENCSVMASRFEAWQTSAIELTGEDASVIGGSFNNYINGAVGTAFVISGDRNLVVVPRIESTATKVTNTGQSNFVLESSDARVVTGSRNGNAALGSLLTALGEVGVIVDSTSA